MDVWESAHKPVDMWMRSLAEQTAAKILQWSMDLTVGEAVLG